MKTCFGRKVKKLWKSTGGNSAPLTIALVLAILLIICGIAEFARLSIIVSGVRDGLQQAVVSVAVTNYDEVYSALREGYSGGYQLTDGGTKGDWREHLDYGDVYGQLDELLGTEKSGGYHVKQQEGGYEYRLSGLTLVIEQPSLAPEKTEPDFKADVRITIEIPLSFGWDMVPPLKMELRTQAVYMPKF